MLFRSLAAARGLALPPGGLEIGVGRAEKDCRWHPPCLWLGIGCERNTSLSLLEGLVDRTLAEEGLAPEAVAGLASCTRKGDEEALLALAAQRGWPLRLYTPEQLSAVAVPHPSEVVAREMGTASVAEAGALVAAGTRLVDPRRLPAGRGVRHRRAGGLAPLDRAAARGSDRARAHRTRVRRHRRRQIGRAHV